MIDAALDLFLAQGYEQTTIDEIAAAVQVSQRTFFRYFAAKEDVLFGYMSEFDHLLVAELAARPARERQFTALFEALRGLLRAIAEGRGPTRWVAALGYADWGEGQLDGELTRPGWFNVAGNEALLFDTAADERWAKGFAGAGVDPRLLVAGAGSA